MSGPIRVGLVGRNIAYSKSGEIFKAAFSIAEIDGQFENLDWSEDEFESECSSLVSSGFRGIAVTIPYKSKVIPFLRDQDPISLVTGAVNSVVVDQGGLHGYNTDRHGFEFGLKNATITVDSEWPAVIFGCGGAASAVVYSLYHDFNLRSFLIVGRSKEKLAAFESRLSSQLTESSFELIESGSAAIPQSAPGIIVNCTPLGGPNAADGNPVPEGISLSGDPIYYDLNYNSNNKALKSAGEKGLRTIDGSAMLVSQALRSLRLWTGINVEFEAVYQAVFGSPG